MRIACFYTQLHPACRKSLPDGTELVWTGNGDDHYWAELTRRWDGHEDLVVIEHDTEVHSGVIPQFAQCDKPWCVFPYEYGPTWPDGPHIIDDALGCTRFSAQLQRDFPLPAIAEEVSRTDGMPPVPFWHSCDMYIRRALHRAGLKGHQHWPMVIHWRGR